MSYVTASYTPARHILPLLAELPGAGATAEINSVAFSRIHWKHFHQVGEYKGVKLLGVFTHGPGQMFNTKRAINKVDDLPGMKIRTGGGIAEAMAKALGASAFVKPAPESYELLSSGVADGMFFPLESIISFKLDTVVKYATLFPGGFYSSAFGFFMNEDKWNKLSKQDQDAIIEGLAASTGAPRRQVLGRRRPHRARGDEEGRHPDRQTRSPNWSRRCRSAPQPIDRRLDQEGDRQGRRRRQGAGRVPRGAEEGRRRQVTARARRHRTALTAAAPGSIGAAGRRRRHRRCCSCMMMITFVDVVGRYLFNWPLRGGFEITELLLLVLIFAGPAAGLARRRARHSWISSTACSARGRARVLERARAGARARLLMFLLAWLIWLKAGKIAGYGDTTDVLRIAVGAVRLLHGGDDRGHRLCICQGVSCRGGRARRHRPMSRHDRSPGRPAA